MKKFTPPCHSSTRRRRRRGEAASTTTAACILLCSFLREGFDSRILLPTTLAFQQNRQEIVTTLQMAPTSGDPNAAWRFASLHGSSIGTNTNAKHPFSESVQEYYYPTNQEIASAVQEEYKTNQQEDMEIGTTRSNNDQEDDLQPERIPKQTLLPMPKLYQGVYQLTNEAEYT